MNLELRTNVLAKSLEIEAFLSQVLATLFRFEKDGSRTLGNKGSSLSFSTKVDLLFDLGRLEKTEYADLQLFMKVRNQLMHNLECDTLLKALKDGATTEILKSSQELKAGYAEANDDASKEKYLNLAFSDLHLRIITIKIRILQSIVSDIEEQEKIDNQKLELEIQQKLMKSLSLAVNESSTILCESILGANHPDLEEEQKKIEDMIFLLMLKNIKKEYPDLQLNKLID